MNEWDKLKAKIVPMFDRTHSEGMPPSEYRQHYISSYSQAADVIDLIKASLPELVGEIPLLNPITSPWHYNYYEVVEQSAKAQRDLIIKYLKEVKSDGKVQG